MVCAVRSGSGWPRSHRGGGVSAGQPVCVWHRDGALPLSAGGPGACLAVTRATGPAAAAAEGRTPLLSPPLRPPGSRAGRSAAPRMKGEL